MKALKSKLLVSITTLVIALVSVAGSAYAWFTLSNTASAQMQFTVTAGDGLQISLDNTNWTNSIDLNNLLYGVGTGIFENETLNAVTSKTGYNDFKILKGDFTNPLAPVYTLDGANPNKDFVTFPLYFRTPSNSSAFLALDTVNSKAVNVTADAVQAAKAVRVSFSDVLTPTSAIVWEPNASTGKGNYIADLSAPISGAAWDVFNNTIAAGSDVTALQTYHAGLPVAGPATNVAASLSKLSPDASLWAETTPGYYYTSVQVRIWIEGFDEDAYDVIFKQLFNLDLVFNKG